MIMIQTHKSFVSNESNNEITDLFLLGSVVELLSNVSVLLDDYYDSLIINYERSPWWNDHIFTLPSDIIIIFDHSLMLYRNYYPRNSNFYTILEKLLHYREYIAFYFSSHASLSYRRGYIYKDKNTDTSLYLLFDDKIIKDKISILRKILI